jgi:proteasome accessory factor C
MLPWLAERGTVRTADMAAHFGLTVGQLVADLELATLCGLPPYLDEMIDLVIDEDQVTIGVPRLFTRPLRLTAPEGFALVAAARAAMKVPGSDPGGALARAVAKVSAALGVDPEGVLDVDLGLDDHLGQRLADLRDAVTDGAVLQLRYWAATRDEVIERVVEPRDVFADRGHWYLRADDRTAGAERIFRIDRIEHHERTGERVAQRPSAPPPAWFDGSADVVPVRLRVGPAARWVAERYPAIEVVELDGGGQEIVLPVVSERWLARLLLRLGPDGELVEPEQWRSLGAATAAAVLRRYQDASASS